MIIVLPFCAKDGALARKNLLWMEELDGRLPFDCVLSHDTETPGSLVQDMTIIARRVFNKVDVFWYPAPDKRHWPAAPNWAWQNVARYIEAAVKQPWLFLEADAVPIRKRWLHDIAEDYAKAGKPFAGHIVDGMGHVNGSCVYPPNVSLYSVGAFRTEETAWDVVLGADLHLREGGMSPYVHAAHTLFQHCWCINPQDGRPWNGAGEVATFKSLHDVIRLVDVTMGVFHRCKDGSLIDWLREYHKDPSAAMVPQHTNGNKNSSCVVGADASAEGVHVSGTTESSGIGGTNDKTRQGNERVGVTESSQPKVDNQLSSNAPAEGLAAGGEQADARLGRDRASAEAVRDAGSESVERNTKEAFKGKCEILIVTYGLPVRRASGLTVSDFDWLAWCLRCIRRHCSGFAGITLAIPARDAEALKPIANEHAQAKGGIPLRIRMFNEPTGKGMIFHMVCMGSADELVPKDTTHVLHVDADVMFKEPITPDEYFVGDKPVYVWRTYDSLAEVRDGQQVVSDCAQWRNPTEQQLGFPTNFYGMTRHPNGFPIAFYPAYRKQIADVHGKPYDQWMLLGQNKFPQDRMDFTAMGAFAYEAMRDKFHWIDISGGNHLAPRDKQKCYWSHGGVTPHIQAEIEGFLK